MSGENVEIVRRLSEEWFTGLERGDPGAPFETGTIADDFEWIVPEPLPDRLVFRGREGFLQWFRTWTGEFENWSAQLERLIDAGNDRVVALTHQLGTGKVSGVPVELNIGMVWELKNGGVVRIRNYLTHAEAREAAGLSE
jgi:ketosteroid isomerase-like protein